MAKFILLIISIYSNIGYCVSPTLRVNATDLVILQGEIKSFPSSTSIWVENGEVLKVEEGTKGIVVKGLRPGTSELKISGKIYNLTVLSLVQDRTYKLLNRSLPQTLGLHSAIQNGIVIVEGQLRRWRDWELIANQCAGIHCQYQMHAKIPENLWAEVEFRLNKTLSQQALPPQKFEHLSPLTLHVATKSTLGKELERVLDPYGIVISKDSNSIELAPLVKVHITVAEVKRDQLLHYGIKWPRTYEAQLLPRLAAGTDPVTLSAEAWEESGAGHVLASPNILCRSGKDAEFLAGGEFPIKIINYRTQDVIWKKYGILLRVSPEADFSGRMSISLETEVSSIDPSRTVDGIPGLYTNRVQSHFDMARPRTIALSGLIKSEESRSSDGLPFLSRIPILGALFSSKDFRENRTELVIFVRPEVLSPDGPSDDINLPQLDEASL